MIMPCACFPSAACGPASPVNVHVCLIIVQSEVSPEVEGDVGREARREAVCCQHASGKPPEVQAAQQMRLCICHLR